jgi:hypothetical protein
MHPNRAVDDTVAAEFGQIVNRHRQNPSLADIILYSISKKAYCRDDIVKIVDNNGIVDEMISNLIVVRALRGRHERTLFLCIEGLNTGIPPHIDFSHPPTYLHHNYDAFRTNAYPLKTYQLSTSKILINILYRVQNVAEVTATKSASAFRY